MKPIENFDKIIGYFVSYDTYVEDIEIFEHFNIPLHRLHLKGTLRNLSIVVNWTNKTIKISDTLNRTTYRFHSSHIETPNEFAVFLSEIVSQFQKDFGKKK